MRLRLCLISAGQSSERCEGASIQLDKDTSKESLLFLSCYADCPSGLLPVIIHIHSDLSSITLTDIYLLICHSE